MIKILLADDHGLFRDSMAVWLQRLSADGRKHIDIDFSSSFDEVAGHLSKQRYDLILLDLNMPGMEGVISVRHFAALAANTPIVVVSADDNQTTIRACMDAGIAGYVTKSSDGETILQALRQVLAGQSCFPALPNGELPRLNEKQQKILSLIIKGNSNRAISEQLHLTEGTVKQYVSQLLDILDVDNRTQAAKKARELLGMNQL